MRVIKIRAVGTDTISKEVWRKRANDIDELDSKLDCVRRSANLINKDDIDVVNFLINYYFNNPKVKKSTKSKKEESKDDSDKLMEVDDIFNFIDVKDYSAIRENIKAANASATFDPYTVVKVTFKPKKNSDSELTVRFLAMSNDDIRTSLKDHIKAMVEKGVFYTEKCIKRVDLELDTVDLDYINSIFDSVFVTEKSSDRSAIDEKLKQYLFYNLYYACGQANRKFGTSFNVYYPHVTEETSNGTTKVTVRKFYKDI